jgi:hypothetical protein
VGRRVQRPRPLTQLRLKEWGSAFSDLGFNVHATWLGIYIVAATVLNNIRTFLEGTVNGMIDAINPLWTKLGNPPIPHITIDLVNLGGATAELDALVRSRTANVFVNVYEQAIAGGGGARMYAEGTPFVPFTGPAIVHRGEAILSADQNPFAGGSASSGLIAGGGEIHTHVYLDGREIARAVSTRLGGSAILQGGSLG